MPQFWNLAFPPYTTVAIMTDQKKTRRQVLEEFVQKSPADAFSRYGLAMECMSTGDASAAIHNFDVLLKQNADYIPAYLMYGQLLVRESRPEEAKQILTTGIAAAGKRAISMQFRKWKRCWPTSAEQPSASEIEL